MLYFAYSLLSYCLLPFGLLRLWWRGLRSPAYRLRWRERLALYDAKRKADRPTVVFHAVSVGEVHAAEPLLHSFMQQHPQIAVVLTTATPTGSQRVQALFGDKVEHVYLPWDLPGACRRFLQRFRPCMLVLLETELWPNLLRTSYKQNCAIVLANARLSEKSHRGYKRFAPLARVMCSQLSLVAAQSDSDARRFVDLGLAHDRVMVNGSLKFDVTLDAAIIARANATTAAWAKRPVWIAASTREGEDAQVLDAHMTLLTLRPDALLLLVPRHPERFLSAARDASNLGLQVQANSAGETLDRNTQVLIGDTMGDMVYYYSLSKVAFVGGSLVPTGCQNIIEPAALGLPVLTGPSLFNFQKVSELLQEAGAMLVIEDATQLALAINELFHDEQRRAAMGLAAQGEVARNRGATDRLSRKLHELLPAGTGAGYSDNH